jgi:flagellum-specific ATP synthase
VLLVMDSVTRLALARREIGLAAGEPPTARGYTPSVFAELPQLCERCGTFASGGSVTAVFTVLVEGDDLNEPVADHLRSVLDGHIVLSRDMAQRGHHPAIDVLRSVSRLHRAVASAAECELAQRTVAVLALLERHRDALELGVYQRGANPALDAALEKEPALDRWLRQDEQAASRADALKALATIMGEGLA